MRVTAMLIVIRTLRTLSKDMERELEELEIGG